MPHANHGPHLSRRSLLRAAGVGAGALALGATPALAGPRTLLGGELAAAGRGAVEALKFARIMPRSDVEALALATAFDETHQRFADGSFEVLLWPGDLARLELTGVPFRITVDDVIAFDAERRSGASASTALDMPGPARTEYRFLADYTAEMAALADEHPDEVRLFELPLPSLEGRKVMGLEICDRVAEDDGRPVFAMDGITHAREWPSGELMITFAHELVTSSEARFSALRAGARTIIVPVTNPDGFVESREALVQTTNANLALALAIGGRGGEQAYWRKNKRSFTNAFYETLNPDAHGVDPNRNFGHQWGGPGTTNIPAGTPQSQAFRGSGPFSEPESENIRRTLRTHHVITANSSHTFSDAILFPQGHTSSSPDEALLRQLAERQADDTGRTNPNRKYRAVSIQEFVGGAGAVGGSIDWMYAALGTMAYTYEHGNAGDGFHPAYDRQADLYTRMREAFLTLGEAAMDTSLHGIIKGRVVQEGPDGGPVPAEIRVTKDFRINLWRDGSGDNDTGESSIPELIDTRMRTEDGTFTYHVAPSTRPFETDVPGVDEATPYRLTITGDDGRFRGMPVEIDRGQTVDLGVIRL
jgi:hypothetical protein